MLTSLGKIALIHKKKKFKFWKIQKFKFLKCDITKIWISVFSKIWIFENLNFRIFEFLKIWILCVSAMFPRLVIIPMSTIRKTSWYNLFLEDLEFALLDKHIWRRAQQENTPNSIRTRLIQICGIDQENEPAPRQTWPMCFL